MLTVLSRKPSMSDNNNFLDIYKSEENICSILQGKSKSPLTAPFTESIRPYSNLLSDSCPFVMSVSVLLS